MSEVSHIKFSGFEPTSEEILAQFAPPSDQDNLRPQDLSPLLRALLEIDGTVTSLLEAYVQEPISVLKLGQGDLSINNGIDFLQLAAGRTVTTRQVLLWGERSHRVYVYGSSLIVSERLPSSLRQAIREPKRGLGTILRESRLETFREILWRYREFHDVLPEAIRPLARVGFVSRTYVIHHGGRPIMAINEKFPQTLE